MKNILLSFLFVFVSQLLVAQPQFGTHFLSNTLQQSQTNPAFLPEEGLIISLPNIYSNLELVGPALEDILGENAQGETVIDVDKAISNFEETNSIRENLDLETIGVAFGLGPVRLSFQHAIRFGTFLKYPKSIPQLVWQGNAQFIGQNLSLNNDIQISAYNELSAAAAIQLDRFTIGARAKYLTGIGDISTSKNEASL